MINQTAKSETRASHNPHLTVDVHYGRFLTLDAGVTYFRARLKRDMPHFNFESMMAKGDHWILTVRDTSSVTGMAVFSGDRQNPIMDFYYAIDTASTGILMGAINTWRRR